MMAHTTLFIASAVAYFLIISSLLPLAHSFRYDHDDHYSHVPPPPVSPPALVPQNELGLLPGTEANCGCVQKDRCGDSTLAYTKAVIQAQASSLVCGRAFQLCCIKEDKPWPGVIVSIEVFNFLILGFLVC